MKYLFTLILSFLFVTLISISAEAANNKLGPEMATANVVVNGSPNVTLAPNPCNTYSIIKFENPLGLTHSVYEVQNIEGNSTRLNVNSLEPGMYFVFLYRENQKIYRSRLIISRN
jgi:vancomycin resistance protein YoaR